MKKKILALLVTACTFVSVFAVSVSAVEPGASDYVETKEVIIADVAGSIVELTNVDSGVLVSMDKSVLPEGVTGVKFEARTVTASDTATVNVKALAAEKGMTNVTLFDFSLINTTNNSKISKLNGKVSITVACPTGVNTVLYFNEDTNTIENLGGTLSKDGKFITFETSHFSYYALATTPKATTLPSVNPQTGDTTPILALSVIAVIAAAGLFVVGKKVFSK